MKKLLFAANGDEMDSKEEINRLWETLPALMDPSVAQLLHLWLREHHTRGDRNILRLAKSLQ